MSQSNTVQSVVNFASAHIELMPLASVGGFNNEPALSLANDTLAEILSAPYAWKFNRATMNLFVPHMNRQDSLFAGATAFVLSSSGNLGGAGIALKSLNGITSTGFPGTVTVNTLDNHDFNVGDTVYLTGVADNVYNSTSSITPTVSQWLNGYVITAVPSSTSFQFAAVSGQTIISGAPGITNFGWAENASMTNQQEDSSPRRVRYLEAARKLEPASQVGTPERFMVTDNEDGTLTIRVSFLAGAAPWGISIVYQEKVAPFVALTDKWPIPDEYAFMYRQVFLAKAFDYFGSGRAQAEDQKAERAILKALAREDAESDEEYIVPTEPLMGFDVG